jgi:hypothetical protein
VSAIDLAKFNRTALAWQKACQDLGVRITAPYQLQSEGETINCLGFLPDFGGNQGMVIGVMDLPEVQTDKRLFELARRKAMFCSFINVSAYINKQEDQAVYKNALNDWGYYGAWENCPSWFSGIKGGRVLP